MVATRRVCFTVQIMVRTGVLLLVHVLLGVQRGFGARGDFPLLLGSNRGFAFLDR